MTPAVSTMPNETVEVLAVEQGISMIRLNRPSRLNAISFELVADLHTALDVVGNDASCKAVILTGAGRGFCSGMDLKYFGKYPRPGEHPHVRVGIDAQTFISNLTVHMRDTPQIVIAAVNGVAFGGGLAFACAADIRLASPEARFCSAFIRTGLSGTDIGITYLLPRLIGNARAFDLILTGREIDAAEAHAMGLVSRVSAVGELESLALDYARTLASYTSVGLRTTKEVLWRNTAMPTLEQSLALEIRNQNLLQHNAEVQEYMTNYRQRTTGIEQVEKEL